MHVFKKKSKVKDETYIIPPAVPLDPVPPSKMSRSLRRKQKGVVEAVPNIDLSTALPDTNDFRTSLLMPGLSARFSMLREQDDPSTKIGKASDDSVLFPKRASRMNLFAHNPLTDIAEVESIRTSVKVPFAEPERSSSYSDAAGYASDDAAGVIGRSRPTEGNNLFGGRQKLYRIPNGSASARDLSEGPAPLTAGRHLYQNDVVLSPYQQMRKAREEQAREHSQERRLSAETDEHESSVVNTPSTGFSKSRGTTSSTASGPSNRRTSTAATSVVSDTPHPRQSNLSAASNTKGQAYDYGSEEFSLNRNGSSESRRGPHSIEPQGQPPLPTSPITSRQLPQSKSVSNLAEKYARGPSPFSTTTPRSISPPPTVQAQALASLDFGLKSANGHIRKYQTASPTNDYEDGDVYHQSLQPNDRGKATAMGLFNRPRQQFDEQKFQERQLQMQHGRSTPPTATELDQAEVAHGPAEPVEMALPSIPSSPLIQETFSMPGPTASRSRSQSSASSLNAAKVQAQVAALINRQNQEYSNLQATKPTTRESPPQPKASPSRLQGQPSASRGTFFDNFDGSSDEEAEADSPMLGRFEPAPRLTPADVHPALRDGTQTFDFGDNTTLPSETARSASNDEQWASSSPVQDMLDTPTSKRHSARSKPDDSPTIGAATGLGLSGLIRTHLRHDSDRSSVLPPPSPVHASSRNGAFPELREREPSIASTARTVNPPESTHSDPWEFENTHRPQRSPLEPQSNDPIPSMSQKAQQILGQAMSHRNQHAAKKAQKILGQDAPVQGEDPPATRAWQNEMMSSHHRGESTETQKEFGNELAERARRIQEGLKGAVDAEKRSRSPGLRQERQNPAAQALHALRHKSSKTSLAARANEPQPKAMKMLGIGSGPRTDAAGRSPNMAGASDHEFDHVHEEYRNRPLSRPRPSESEPPNGRRTPGFQRSAHPNYSEEDFERARQRSATPTSGRGPRRERAESAAGDRSRSRTGRTRDEPPYSPGRQGLSQASHWEQRPYGPPHGPPYGARGPSQGPHGRLRGPPPVEMRNYERSASAMSNRRPSESRPGPSGYMDGRSATPTMGSTPRLGTGPLPMNAPRPSPRPPFPHSPISPFLPQPGLSPAVSGPPSAIHSALPSPSGPLPQPPTSMNGRSTPVAEGRSTPLGNRKRSVTKGMISEPTFISSTSSVPLVGLPSGGPRPSQIATPPIPIMNPRRRTNTMTDRPEGFPSPQMGASIAPDSPDLGGVAVNAASETFPDHQKPPPRARNRLRKISSEGGGMAARARNQAMMAEFSHEKLRSPALPVFPNRSATSLALHQDGGMF